MRSEYLEPGGYARLLTAMTWPNALAVRVALETGLRITDVLCRKLADLAGCTLSGTACKTGKFFSVQLTEQTARDLRANAWNGWLFPGRGKQGYRTRQAVWKDMVRAARVTGVRGVVTPHSARKTFAVEKRRADGLEAAMAALQHDRKELTKAYAYSDTEIRGLDVDRLARAIAEKLGKIFLDAG